MDNICRIEQLRKEYKEFVLDDVSLNLPRGYITGLIGPNGAGKTTTIKLIMALIRADGGRIRVDGLDPFVEDIKVKNIIGYVGEEQYFYQQRSAGWTGRFVSHFFDAWDHNMYLSLLDRFGLPPKKTIKKYSKGMKVKLALAVALSHHPEFVILDEPTSGLDPVVRRDVMNYLKQYSMERNKSVLISSHITDDIARTADFTAFMIQGKIELFAAKDDLLSNWKKIHFTPETLDEKTLSALEGVENHMFGSAGYTRRYTEIQELLSGPQAEGKVKVENMSLDDILIFLAGRK